MKAEIFNACLFAQRFHDSFPVNKWTSDEIPFLHTPIFMTEHVLY